MRKRKIEKKDIILLTMFVTTLLLIGTIPLQVTADDPTLVYVSPANTTVSAGQTFTLNIACTPGQLMKSYELCISFNPTLLHANSVIEGTIFTGYTTFFNAGTIDNTAGTISHIYGLIVGAGGVTNPGSLVSLSFTAQDASGITSIGLFDVGITNETAYIPITVTNGTVILREFTLTVTVDGSGTVTKNPNQATYPYGTVVQLTAVANAGWVFSSWSGNLTGSTNPTSITMNENKSVTAHFTQNQYTLTVTVDGSGSVTKNPDQTTYSYGQIVTLTAVPGSGWAFSSWTGDLTGSQNPTTITMNGNKAVTAHFTANQYTLTITTDGTGSVTKNPDQTTYSYGQIVTLTAVPGSGWAFSSWTGDLTGSQNPTTITMNGNKAVTAHFVDSMSPQILNISRTTSNPLDTDPTYGWVNISCTVTDNVAVSQVIVRIHNSNGSWNNVSMTPGASGKYNYLTTTSFSTIGNYSYSIQAIDTNNNVNTSSNVLFSMPPNWDINSDGTCEILDLVLISNHYGQTGANGWIREDADNNGEIQVLDMVYLSNHYSEAW